jgi:hypothetical protein
LSVAKARDFSTVSSKHRGQCIPVPIPETTRAIHKRRREWLVSLPGDALIEFVGGVGRAARIPLQALVDRLGDARRACGGREPGVELAIPRLRGYYLSCSNIGTPVVMPTDAKVLTKTIVQWIPFHACSLIASVYRFRYIASDWIGSAQRNAFSKDSTMTTLENHSPTVKLDLLRSE